MSTINYHLSQIDESGEVHLSEAIRKIQIPSDKWDEQGVLMYNLDVIIAVGYRVNSYEATQFRIWAREVLKQYIIKGYVMDDERLKGKDRRPCPPPSCHEDGRLEVAAKALGEYEKYWRIQDQKILSDFDKFIEDLTK